MNWAVRFYTMILEKTMQCQKQTDKSCSVPFYTLANRENYKKETFNVERVVLFLMDLTNRVLRDAHFLGFFSFLAKNEKF